MILGTSWGHTRDVMWTNLWVRKVLKILRQKPCAAWQPGHRTSPRRRTAHPVQKGDLEDRPEGQPTGHPGGRPPGGGTRATESHRREAQRSPARLRSSHGSPSGVPTAHLRVRHLVRLRADQWVRPRTDRRRPLHRLVGGASLRLQNSLRDDVTDPAVRHTGVDPSVSLCTGDNPIGST